MPSPFPGMDPYLEGRHIWPDFHNRLALRLSDELNHGLPRPYYALLEMRAEVGIVSSQRVHRRVIPDVVVVGGPRSPLESRRETTAVLERGRVDVSKSVEIEIEVDPVQHRFVEIRDSSRGHKLITLIEIMSPSNKQPGPDRDAYEQKREEVLDSDAGLIELDLLRGGLRALEAPALEWLGAEDEPPPAYMVLINRAWRRTPRGVKYEVFPVGIREPLPRVPVPLQEGEPEPVLDLQHVFNQIYDGGPYARGAVDYTKPPPEPALSPEDAAWALALTSAWLAAAPASSP